MADEADTVELPANGEIKQLAHDVAREDREDVVPMLRDFYQFLSMLDDGYVEEHRMKIDAPESDLSAEAWERLIEPMRNADLVEKNTNGGFSYTLK